MATINPTYNETFNESKKVQAFRRACNTWENVLQNDISINIITTFADLGDEFDAMCIPNLVQGNFRGKNITVTTAQAKALGVASFVTNPKDYDMVILLSNKADYFNYTDQKVIGKPHFETTVLHELCHGLGFLGLCNVDDETESGKFSDIALIDILEQRGVKPIIPFWGKLKELVQDYPTLFAYQFKTNGGMATTNAPESIYDLFRTSKSMHIPCDFGIEHMSEMNYYIYTENNSFSPFTSGDHIDMNTSLMYYTVSNVVITNPDPPTQMILTKIGWNINVNLEGI